MPLGGLFVKKALDVRKNGMSFLFVFCVRAQVALTPTMIFVGIVTITMVFISAKLGTNSC